MAERRFWLVKSEPDNFSIQDLAKAPKMTTGWDGVRNFRSRNYLRDQMQVGDRVLFYHSGVVPPAIVGTATVVRAGYPDPTAWDKKNWLYDPRSTRDNPRWYMVDIKLERIFKRPLTVDELRKIQALKKMEALRPRSRFSVTSVQPSEFDAVLKLAGKK